MSMKVTRAEFIGIEHMDEGELRDFACDIFAENEKLRAERDEWHRVAQSKQDIIDNMRDATAENAKLREMVLEIWRSCPVSEDDCAKCQHRIEESDEVWCDIPILMSELGIEVP